METYRIGLDTRCGRRVSVGMATYVREVSVRLPAAAPEFEFRTYAQGQNLGLAEQIVLPMQMRRDRLDLTHFMAHYVPVFASGLFIFTIHDLIHLRFRQFFRAYIGPYYMTVVRRACHRAARIITSDDRTIGDLVHYFNVDPQKIRVIPLAPRDRFLAPAPAHRGPRPYVLNVGNHRRHKDLATLLAAWAALPARCEIDLYFTGPDDFGGELQRNSTATRRALALGDVSDDALASYYAGATVLVQPALLEGFGLPFVEAMAAGCPVVASEDALPSVLRDVALSFPVQNVEAARAAILKLVDDDALRARLAGEGQARARTLTWDRCAAATADVYRELLEVR